MKKPSHKKTKEQQPDNGQEKYLTIEEYLETIPEKCRTCVSEPICYKTPDHC